MSLLLSDGLVFFSNDKIKTKYELVLVEFVKNISGNKFYKLKKYNKNILYIDELDNYWNININKLKNIKLLYYKNNEFMFYDTKKNIIKKFKRNVKFRFNHINYKTILELYEDTQNTLNFIVKNINLQNEPNFANSNDSNIFSTE